MKFLERLGLILFSFITLVLSVLLIMVGVGVVDVNIFSILVAKVISNPTAIKVMYGVCAVLILIAIRCLFFGSGSSSSKDELTGIMMENEDGKLLITHETLETIVDGVINNVDDIIAASPDITITRDNEVIVSVMIDVKQHTVIKLVTSKLQTDIKDAIKEATDIEVKNVDVQVRNVEADEVSDTDFAEKYPDKVVLDESETSDEEVVDADDEKSDSDEKFKTSTDKKGKKKTSKK